MCPRRDEDAVVAAYISERLDSVKVKLGTSYAMMQRFLYIYCFLYKDSYCCGDLAEEI